MTATATLAAFTEQVMAGTLTAALSALLARRDFGAWSEKVQAARGCAKPVRLVGSTSLVETGGTVLDETHGRVFVPCKNRRAAVCESCSAHYAHDTYHLVHAGMAGGKGVPDTVADHPQLLVTLTAPSFGLVHSHSTTAGGQARRCGCGATHSPYVGYWPDAVDQIGSLVDGALGCTGPVPA